MKRKANPHYNFVDDFKQVKSGNLEVDLINGNDIAVDLGLANPYFSLTMKAPPQPFNRYDDPRGGGGGGGPIHPLPITPTIPTPVAPPVPETTGSCTDGPSLTLVSNSPTANSTRTQTFVVGDCVMPGYSYSVAVYSYVVSATAVSGDSSTSMAAKLASAINMTSAGEWNAYGSAPSAGTPGFKPTASSSGKQVTVVLNQANQMAGWASGSPAPPPPPPPPPPQPVVNQAPVAVIQSIPDITLPTNIATLNGSGSSDPENDGLTYSWVLISGPNSPSIQSPDSSNSQVSGLVAGTYTFQLTVTDSASNSSSAQVSFNVQAAPAPPNQGPVAAVSPISQVVLPTNVATLDGSGSSDPDGDSLTYQWEYIGGPNSPTIQDSSAQITQVTGLIAGSYSFKLTVADSAGSTNSQPFSFNVTEADPPNSGNGSPAENQPPVAVAGANQTIFLPTDKVLLDGSGSYDPELGQMTYQWAWMSGPNEPTFTNPNKSVAEVSGLIEGEYVYRLTVFDPMGATSESQTKVFVLPQEKEVVYKTAVMGGPYVGGGGAMGAGGGGGGGSQSGTGSSIGQIANPKSLLLLALVSIAVSFVFFKEDASPIK